MKQRAIARDEVVQALTKLEKRMTDSLGHTIAQLETNNKILRVFFVEREGNIIVITAYRTSQEKYKKV
ncbi:MAG: DUF4258 domain-containing protein [Candidatus Thorarchaeota archaeon]|nr:DUF4258 domain-containing protein [Candidatus Thorarchaeota archaeon]